MATLFDSQLADAIQAGVELPTQLIIQPLYGGSPKAVRDMDAGELRNVSGLVMAKVREQAFSRGLPIVYERGGSVVFEYADGRIVPQA